MYGSSLEPVCNAGELSITSITEVNRVFLYFIARS